MNQLPGLMVTQTLPICPSGHCHSLPHTLPALLLDCSFLTAWHGELLLTNYFSYFLEKYHPDPSVQFSRSVVSDSLRPHEPQHARPPCPSPTPGVHSDLRCSSRWCHPTISSSVVPFSSHPLSLSASESFPMSQLFSWGGPHRDTKTKLKKQSFYHCI